MLEADFKSACFFFFYRVSVTRAIKPLMEDKRSQDFFSQKVSNVNCVRCAIDTPMVVHFTLFICAELRNAVCEDAGQSQHSQVCTQYMTPTQVCNVSKRLTGLLHSGEQNAPREIQKVLVKLLRILL